MQFKRNYVFLELLRFPSAELLQVKNKETIALHKGSLQVIRSNNLDITLLKLDEIKLPLNASLPVIGARSGEHKFPAYLMPTFDGFYLIRILDSNPGVVLTNFETILESTCEYYHRSDMETKLGEIKEPMMQARLGAAKDIINKAKEILARNFLPLHEGHPNYVLARMYNELINVEDQSVPVVDVPAEEVENATAEVEEVIRNHLSNKCWAHFSELEGVPIKQPAFKTMRSMNSIPQIEQRRPFAPSFGSENIAIVKNNIDFENQEIVGKENQRLPLYGVQSSKEHAVQGLASSEGKYYQNWGESTGKNAPILGGDIGKENREIIHH